MTGVEGESEIATRARRLLLAWTAEHHARTSHAAWRCAHTLTGRRHQSGLDPRTDTCWPPGCDHVQLWILPDRRRVLTHHQYPQPETDALELFDLFWGTRSVVLPPSASWYYPDQTWLVELWGPAPSRGRPMTTPGVPR